MGGSRLGERSRLHDGARMPCCANFLAGKNDLLDAEVVADVFGKQAYLYVPRACSWHDERNQHSHGMDPPASQTYISAARA